MLVMLKYIAGIIVAGLVFAYGAQAIQQVGSPTTEQLTRVLKTGAFTEAPQLTLVEDATTGPKASYDTLAEQAKFIEIAAARGALIACRAAGEFNDPDDVLDDAIFARLAAIFAPHENGDGVMAALARVTLEVTGQATAARSKLRQVGNSGEDIQLAPVRVVGKEACDEVATYLLSVMAPGEILGFKPVPKAAPTDKKSEQDS